MSNLLQISKALLAGDFQSITKSYSPSTVYIDPSTYTTPDGSSGWAFSTDGGISSYFHYKDYNDCVNAYTRCPAVNAVVNRKAQAFINGDTWILNNENKEATTSEAKALKALLKKPNVLQSWDQFEAQMYIYVQVFGFCPVLVVKPFGYTRNIDATSLWCIPPTLITFKETNKLFKQTEMINVIESITVTYKGYSNSLDVQDVCIIKDFTPSFNTQIFPESRICALEQIINNSIGALESRNVLINNRGTLGIFSKDTGGTGQFPALPITPNEKETLQKEFKKYGLRKKQWQFIITTAALKWQSVSVPTKDLLLFEEVDSSSMAICDSYGYPYQLLSSAKGTTFSNLEEGKKLLYQDSIIPESKSIYGQLNTFFKTEDYNLKLVKDYSTVPILQKDKVSEAAARLTTNEACKIEWDNDLITLNQWRVRLGDDPVEGGNFTKSQLASQTQQPLINSLGIGGMQALIEVVTNPDLSYEAAIAILMNAFNVPADAAAAMCAGKTLADEKQTATTETTAEAA